MPRPRPTSRIPAALAALTVGALALGAAPWRRAPEPPRLVVWLVVDQGRGDGADRLGSALAEDGLRRFKEDGAWFTDARYRHMSTWTASGHATLATGAYPHRHGVAANYWFEGGARAEAADGDAFIAGAPSGLWVSTLGDELHLADASSRVVSVSLKDRAAIVMGGDRSDGTYWLDTQAGRFVGRGRGGAAAPWVTAFNASGAVDAPFGSTWETRLPREILEASGPDACDSETDALGLGRTFPHPVRGGLDAPGPAYYKTLLRVPQGTGLLLDFALAAVDGEGLGGDDAPDVLFVSVSTTDYAGHFYGLQSWEYLELIADLDQRLGPFVKALERRVGRGRVGLVLSADHGGPPIAECIPDRIDGGRVGYNQVTQAVEDALIHRFGLHGEEGGVTSDGGWVVGFEPPGLWLDIPPGVDAAAVKAEASRALLALPGIADVCDTDAPAGPWAEACELATVKGRAPQLMIINRPYFTFADEAYGGLGTTHGSPNAYDARILLGMWGPGIRPQVRRGTEDPARMAATVASWLGVSPPAGSEVGAFEGIVEGGGR